MKLLAPQIWREYFWLFNRTCALSICFWGFSCQGKKSIWYKIPQSGRKRSNFYELGNIQKSLEGESKVERWNYSATLVHKKTRTNILCRYFCNCERPFLGQISPPRQMQQRCLVWNHPRSLKSALISACFLYHL